MEWKSVNCDADAKELLKFFGSFHDACIREAHLCTDHFVDEGLCMITSSKLDTCIKFVVQRQFDNPRCIELLFEQVTRFNFVPSPENYDSIIYESNLGMQDGVLIWIIDSYQSLDDMESNKDSWVCARKLRWRVADDLIGPELAYGSNT